MGGGGVIRLSVIWAALDHCLAGHEKRETDHHWRITMGERTYPRLPVGGHGERDPEIQKGHLRRLVRFFGIEACVEEFLASR